MAKDIDTGLSLQGFVPLRHEPYGRSEMVSQVLFGEAVDILDDDGKWLFVRCRFDGYEGWLDAKSLVRSHDLPGQEVRLADRNFEVMDENGRPLLRLPAGSVIPGKDGDRFSLSGKTFILDPDHSFRSPGDYTIEELVDGVMGVPYIWGGRSGFGFDCSGLVQYVFRALGSDLPRDAVEQSALGHTLGFINEARAGDLAFFDDAEGLIHHVGMIMGEGYILHASGRVRIDRIDQQGIYDREKGEYTHKLRVLKRITT